MTNAVKRIGVLTSGGDAPGMNACNTGSSAKEATCSASNGRCELFMGPHRITIGVNPCVIDRCAQEVVERCHALPLLVHQERNVLQVRVRVSNQSVEEDPAVHRHARYRPVTALADEILELG